MYIESDGCPRAKGEAILTKVSFQSTASHACRQQIWEKIDIDVYLQDDK